MAKSHKRRKPIAKPSKVSRTKLMNLNQLLPSDKKYRASNVTRELIHNRNFGSVILAQEKEQTQLMNLSRKVKNEQNKALRFATESSDTNQSTREARDEKQAPAYYMHKVFIGMMDDRKKETEYTSFKYHFEHTTNVFGIIKEIRNQMPKASLTGTEPKTKTKHSKKLLVLDLDETLVSSNECPPHNWDDTHIINFGLPNKFDFTIYVKFRPFVTYFLETISQHYEIAIFTASEKDYADAIINKLDPERKLISQRYYNTDCDKLNGIFIKDVSKLNRSLKDVVIVDNTVLCFAYQLENGVPILSYYGDSMNSDRELFDLREFLCYLKDFEDVRKPIAEYFKWATLDECHKNKNRSFESIFYD